jgi:vacuolar-type H+-ATPase subunit E/Vma4
VEEYSRQALTEARRILADAKSEAGKVRIAAVQTAERLLREAERKKSA